MPVIQGTDKLPYSHIRIQENGDNNGPQLRVYVITHIYTILHIVFFLNLIPAAKLFLVLSLIYVIKTILMPENNTGSGIRLKPWPIIIHAVC